MPVIQLLVAQGGQELEATLVDPSVMYLLKQKREQGMFSSFSLGDLLAPNLGVLVRCSSTNRTELVEASKIRIAQYNPMARRGSGFAPQIMDESKVDRKHLISTLRESSSLAEEAIRRQYLPLSQGVLPQAPSQGVLPQMSLTQGVLPRPPLAQGVLPPAFSHENISLNDMLASKRKRKLSNNYSSWLHEKYKSVSPETTVAAASSLAAMNAANNVRGFPNRTNIVSNDQRAAQSSERATNQYAPEMASFFKNSKIDDLIAERLKSSSELQKRASHLSGILLPPQSGTNQQEQAQTTKEDANAMSGNSKAWECMYGRLLKHMEERGIDKAPTRINMDPELRTWVAQQRLDFKKRNLNSERQFLLRSVGFHRDKFTLKWDAKFERLRAFKTEHGHTNVPFHYANDRQLGTWVSKQRVRIRQGTISDEEKVRLEAIGFVPNRFNARWEEMFRRLVAYKKIYKDANVPRVYEKDTQLAQWCLNQKDNFREGKMKPERQIKLEAIGFSWSTFYEGDLEWEGNFQKLLAYKAMHGHVRFFKDPKLSRWVALQQSLHSTGTLNRQRMELLVSIGALPSAAQSARAAMQQQQQASSSAMPPMALRQSFSDWNPAHSSSTSTFL